MEDKGGGWEGEVAARPRSSINRRVGRFHNRSRSDLKRSKRVGMGGGDGEKGRTRGEASPFLWSLQSMEPFTDSYPQLLLLLPWARSAANATNAAPAPAPSWACSISLVAPASPLPPHIHACLQIPPPYAYTSLT